MTTYVAEDGVGNIVLRDLFKGLQLEFLQLCGTQELVVGGHSLAHEHVRRVTLHALFVAIILVQIVQRLEESFALRKNSRLVRLNLELMRNNCTYDRDQSDIVVQFGDLRHVHVHAAVSAANIALRHLRDLLQQLRESLFGLSASVVVRTGLGAFERVRGVMHEVVVDIADVGANGQQAESGCLALENLHRGHELVNHNATWLGGNVLFELVTSVSTILIIII